MEIKERIKRISNYFREMQVTTVNNKQVVYVVVQFPKGWIIDDDIEDKFNVTISEGTNFNEYYFCADIETGEDAVFDAIEYNIEKMQDAIERAQLLAEKTKELRLLFENDTISLSQLKTLKLTFDETNETLDEIVIPKKKKQDTNIKEKNSEIDE